VERTAREAQVGRVGDDHDHVRVAEPGSQRVGSSRVELDGDHPRASRDQWAREGPVARADVEDEVARRDARVGDEALRPLVSELVEPPSRPSGGHG
jgi:hypothetical protein